MSLMVPRQIHPLTPVSEAHREQTWLLTNIFIQYFKNLLLITYKASGYSDIIQIMYLLKLIQVVCGSSSIFKIWTEIQIIHDDARRL